MNRRWKYLALMVFITASLVFLVGGSLASYAMAVEPFAGFQQEPAGGDLSTTAPVVVQKPDGGAGGIASLSGSYVEFDPSAGGEACFIPGATQTFCFTAESFSPDWEYVYNLWEKFPSDWTVTDVYFEGTPWCDNGTWGTFEWSFETSPYEVNIYHPRYQGSGGANCIATYCFDVISGTGAPEALASWYWDGDGYGAAPHNPCSDDQYTPAGQNACDEWINPQAAVPPCVLDPIMLTPQEIIDEGCPCEGQEHELTVWNNTGYDTTVDLTYAITQGSGNCQGPASVVIPDGMNLAITVELYPQGEAGDVVVCEVYAEDASDPGNNDTSWIIKNLIAGGFDPAGWQPEPNAGATPMQWGAGVVGTNPTAAGEVGYYAGGLREGSSIIRPFLEMYDPDTATWTQLADLPNPRFSPVAAWIDGLLYAAGGYDTAFSATNDLQVYNPISDTWDNTTYPDLPAFRGGGAGGLGVCSSGSGECLFHVGGGPDGSFANTTLETWQYDPVAMTWTQLDNKPAGVSPDGHILGAGVGCLGEIYVGGDYRGFHHFHRLDATQPSGSQWSQLADIPAAAGAMTPAMVCLEDQAAIMLIGGDPDGGWGNYNTTVYVYDIATDTWEGPLAQTLNVGQLGSAGLFMHDKVWTFGGTVGSGAIAPAPHESLGYIDCEPCPSECTAFFDDFEAGYENWSMSGLWNPENEADTCGSLVTPFPSPYNNVYYGVDGQCSYDTGAANSGFLELVHDIDLTGVYTATLEFWSYEETECGGGNCGYDVRYVEASTDGGATWDTVWDSTGPEGSWYQASANLDAYTGGPLRIRFYFNTFDSELNDYFGWMVDDVHLKACVPVIEEPAFEAWKEAPATAEPGEVIRYSIFIEADELVNGMYMVDPLPVGVEYAGNLTWSHGEAWYDAGDNAVYWEYLEPAAAGEPAGSRTAVYDPEAVADLIGGVEPPGAPLPDGVVQTFTYPQAILWDNGPLVTHPGGGFGGADASRLQTSLGMNTLGFGHQFINGYRMADDFEITDPGGWWIDTVTFFAYQTGAPIDPSTMTGVYYQIWDGPPNDPGSTIVWGDLVTNRMVDTVWSNIYRDSETTPNVDNRPIMANTASAGQWLPPGVYWLDWMTDGSLASGPWAPPVTILGEITTGNALQYTTDWAPANDSGTLTQQDMPFIIEGTTEGGPVLVEVSFDVTVTGLPGEVIVNEGWAGAPGSGDVPFAAVTEVVGVPPIEIDAWKEAPATAAPGEVFGYTITIEADMLVNGMYMVDPLPAGVEYAGNLTWSHGEAWYDADDNTVYWEYNELIANTPAPQPAVDKTLGLPAPVFQSPSPSDLPPIGLTLSNNPLAILDDFNRADGPIGDNWTVHDGYCNVSNNAAVCGSMARATFNDAPGDGYMAEADISTVGTELQYTGLLLNYGAGSTNLFLKVQEQSATGQFSHAACYTGNNGTPFGLGFFTLDSPFSTAHMRATRVGDDVTIEFTDIDGGGQPPQTYLCTGAPPAEGPGIGIMGYAAIARLDNFGLPGEAPEQVTISFDVEVTGEPGEIIVNEGWAGLPEGDPVLFAAATEVVGTPDITVDPLELWAEVPVDTTAVQELNICNVGNAPLEWEIHEMEASPPAAFPAATTLEVLWDQPLSTVNQNAYVNQEFGDYPTSSSFLADDFTNFDPWQITSIFVPGNGWNGFTTLFNATALTWQIYEDCAGVPCGDPSGGGSPPVWTLTLPPTDSQVVITTGSGGMPSNVELVLDTPGMLPSGTWWLVFYPTMDFGTGGQHGRQPADTTNGYHGQFINPGGAFGYGTDWQDWVIIGATQQDIAFRIEGSIALVDVPWLSEDPTSGVVPPGECQVVEVTFDATGMEPGDYFADLLVNSNDPDTPQVVVPVTMTVVEIEYGLEVNWADSELFGEPGEMVTFEATITNLGNVEDTFDLTFADNLWDVVIDPETITLGAGASAPVSVMVYIPAEAEDGDWDDVMITVLSQGDPEVWHEAMLKTTAVVIIIGDPPVAGFIYAPAEPEEGEEITFTNTTTGTEPITYEWDFGDGATSTAINPTHTYAEAGSYVVTLTATNDFGEDTYTKTIVVSAVEPPPPPVFWLFLPVILQ